VLAKALDKVTRVRPQDSTSSLPMQFPVFFKIKIILSLFYTAL
jgi:hypothetical protein